MHLRMKISTNICLSSQFSQLSFIFITLIRTQHKMAKNVRVENTERKAFLIEEEIQV